MIVAFTIFQKAAIFLTLQRHKLFKIAVYLKALSRFIMHFHVFFIDGNSLTKASIYFDIFIEMMIVHNELIRTLKKVIYLFQTLQNNVFDEVKQEHAINYTFN